MRAPLVVDASALVAAFANRGELGAAARERLVGHRLHAPHLVDAEVGNALRRMVRRDELTADAGDRSRRLAERAVRRRHPVAGRLAARAWALRANVSFYDAVYVALAESLGAPLVTADSRLAASNGPRCWIEVL